MVKKRFFGGQKMVQKWSRNGPKNDPKMAKKFTGVPQKMPKNPKKIDKMAKNGPTQPHVSALKRVKMH